MSVRNIQLSDLTLKCRKKRGDSIEVDVSCDSNYMIGAMERIGEAMRRSFHWIPMNQPCYLVLDNAGGHGKKDIIKQYSRTLIERYNIQLIHQVPRSPFSNVLDLGVWCAMQSTVHKVCEGKQRTVEILNSAVMATWSNRRLMAHVL